MFQLNNTLSGLGLGTLGEDSVESFAGRNPNWAGTTSTGARVFVKHISGDARAATGRLRRAITVETERLASRFGLVTPRCLGWDERARLIVFELLTPARSGAALAAVGQFDDDVAEQAGRLVAALHSAHLPAEAPAPPFPAAAPLAALSWSEFVSATAAELELWRIVQNDDALAAALDDLRRSQERVPSAPTHCDLRLDQFVHHDGRLYLTDWEELRAADPARDIGTFAGEWLHHAITRLDTGDAELSHTDVVDLATAEFAGVRPRVSAFWRSYADAVDRTDPDLPVRATAFAGWHQFTRAFAGAHASSRLSVIDRAAAGIGRTALLAPHQFAEELGLGSDT
jgi:phosphotransferase family enzyme